MMRWTALVALVLLTQTSCVRDPISWRVVSAAEKAVRQCVSKLAELQKEDTLTEADHAYVDVFENGFTVGFSHGAVGSFGTRNPQQRSLWACGVTKNTVVWLGAPSKNPIIDQPVSSDFENYEEDVIEVLFLRDGNSFRYHKAQMLDEKNLLKHNPNLYKKLEDQGSASLLME